MTAGSLRGEPIHRAPLVSVWVLVRPEGTSNPADIRQQLTHPLRLTLVSTASDLNTDALQSDSCHMTSSTDSQRTSVTLHGWRGEVGLRTAELRLELLIKPHPEHRCMMGVYRTCECSHLYTVITSHSIRTCYRLRCRALTPNYNPATTAPDDLPQSISIPSSESTPTRRLGAREAAGFIATHRRSDLLPFSLSCFTYSSAHAGGGVAGETEDGW